MELQSNSVCFILLLGAFHLVLTCLMSLNLVLMNYMKNLQYDLKDKYVNSKKISEIIDNGFTLVELSKSANIIFGKLLALEYLSNMGMNVVATFISLNIFKAFSTFEPTLFLLSIGSFIVVISYYIKLYYYARVGQNLCNAYKEIGAGVEWVVRQILDNFLTNVQYLSNVCPIFVKVMSMSNLCPNS